MSADISVKAPAKINLGLKVFPRRKDGFHNIESIFQTVNLCDELRVKLTARKNIITVSCGQMILPENNTIVVAYKAFRKLFGIDSGVSVCLTKRIPSGGGLGGGSSDAASFLLALSELCKISLSIEDANVLAEEIGSDVFFFLHCLLSTKKCAVVTGRGEKVKPFVTREDLHLVLVFPGVHSSTKEAYNLLDEQFAVGDNFEYPRFEDLETIYKGSVKDWTFVNSFTSVITQKYSRVGEAIAAVKEQGALFTDMSGSGSTVFGVFDSKNAVDNAVNMLSAKWKTFAVV